MFNLFAGVSYYPQGGYADYKGNFNTKEEAIEFVIAIVEYDWWHIVKDGCVVLKKDSEYRSYPIFDFDVPNYEVKNEES